MTPERRFSLFWTEFPTMRQGGVVTFVVTLKMGGFCRSSLHVVKFY